MSYKDKRRRQKEAYALQREVRAAERKASLTPKYKKPPFTPLKPRESRLVETEEMARIRALPSLGVQSIARGESVSDLTLPTEYDEWTDAEREDWMRRERAARSISDERKTQLAPLYNKGGYEFVGAMPPEIIQNLGRKV